jgi:excisionase family DNA binding protein
MKNHAADNNNGKRLIDIHELSRVTGISVSTLYSWVSQRKIPFVKCGRLTKFDVQAIDVWIRKNTVKPRRFGKLPGG